MAVNHVTNIPYTRPPCYQTLPCFHVALSAPTVPQSFVQICLQIRGLCISPDLQCVLCVTEDLEGVYILAIDNLGAQEEGRAYTALSDSQHPADVVNDVSDAKKGGDGRAGGGRSSKTAATAAAGSTARPQPRAAAAAAFPSLLHLASRGQRRRTGAVAHTPAEPVFIASLARRGVGGGQQAQDSVGRRRSSGPGKVSPAGRGRRNSHGSAIQLECLWWAARNGDHFAVIGRPDGEVNGDWG